MTYSEELRQIRKDCNANGKRLDQIQAEFCETLLSKPTTKQENVSVDPDEILAEEIYRAGTGRRVNPDREESTDGNDPDEKLAAEIFAAAGGNTGADPEATEELSPEDEALVEQLFSAGGGNRKQDKNRVSV